MNILHSYIVNNLKVKISPGWREELERKIGRKLSLKAGSFSVVLHRRSPDLRRGRRDFVCKAEVRTKEPIPKKLLAREKVKTFREMSYAYEGYRGDERFVVIGAGPAGLFATYSLAKRGAKPLLLEQGRPVEERLRDVERFWETGELNPKSNIQFGEGGAGTFSDGKLTSRSKDPRITEVLRIFAEHGGPEEILYVNKPHIGSDRLRNVLIRLRRDILESGGEIRFEEEVKDLKIEGNRVTGVVTEQNFFPADKVILATGHSARELFYTLSDRVPMENKPFAVGLRIEHPQSLIDRVQYDGDEGLGEILGAADYHLTCNFKEEDRGTYTFCMCPGGLVVAAASEENRLAVNGMSDYKRDLNNANSAVLVTVDSRDYGSELLGGVEFQRKLEEKAYRLGGGNFTAPVQSVPSFLGEEGEILTSPTYRPGTKPADLRELFPKELTEKLQEGIRQMDRKLSGFAGPYGTLTGVESRSSSPVRILRNRKMESVKIKGLYPVGEGAGYAGGIMSSAVDGLKVVEHLVKDEGVKEK